MTPRCPICRRNLASPAENESHPFCSPRCKLIDLGNWLDGRYRIPGPSALPDGGLGDDETEGGDLPH